MQNKIDYKVSIIIPVYNAEKFLPDCLDSLVLQTIEKGQMEVLLIDDGSTDGSLDICKRYADAYSFFKVFTKENEGASATRNFGIKRALGKYIMYLDSDDMITENTVELVTNFFDEHYNEVDVVTYPERTYMSNGQKKAPHIRYQIMNHTGIYDATKQFYLFLVHMNIVTKNLFDNNLLFDEEMQYHEDQKYCNQLLRDKLRLGFVEGCEYKYILHGSSVTGENTNPIFLFEPTTAYWEEFFASFDTDVPEYYQALYVHDLSWKLLQNCLIPYHYHGKKFKESTERLWNLLKRVSDEVILKHPSLDNFHKYFFLEKKKGAITPFVQENKVALFSEDREIFRLNSFELIFNKLKEKNGKLLFQCTLKSQFFNFYTKPKIYVKEDEKELIELNTFFSLMSYYKCKTITNNFWGFYYECDLAQIGRVEFFVEVDGFLFPTHFYMMPTSPFVINSKIIRNGYMIEYKKNGFSIHMCDLYETEKTLKENTDIISKTNKIAGNLRKLSEIHNGKRIWLYYDCKGVEYDNGYLQFMHDFEKEDGVERYYVLNNDLANCRKLFNEKQIKQVVEFGSNLHKELFIKAEKVITAYIEEINLYPFPAAEKKYYMDIMNAEIVYLQHGILHASLPWKYTPEKIEIDKVVASSGFEIHNFKEKYCFREEDILPYGMPRFEMLNINLKPKNRILFAPSWRMYLIGACVDTVWELTDEKFIASKYFKKIQEFLNSRELIALLEDQNLYLDFKIHPIFRPYLKYFTVESERVVIADNVVKDEDYCLFITDFSSYVFNFAYIRRPIIYFVPDVEEFEAGLNSYRRLDLPLEDGFGPFVQTVDEAVNNVKKIAANRFEIEEKYLDRMNGFFLTIDGCCEKIYSDLSNI